MSKQTINSNYLENFVETVPNYTVEDAKIEAARCLNCKHFPCQQNCPTEQRIPEFIMQIKEGNLVEAYNIISSCSNLPSICGRVCPHEKQCQGVCTRCKMDGTVNIGRLERFVADYVLTEYEKDGFATVKQEVAKRVAANAKVGAKPKIAIIGSGPAGLSAAQELAKYGFASTVFERENQVGGVLRLGIPSFRLPVEVVERQENLLRALGVEFELGVEIVAEESVGAVSKKVMPVKKLVQDYDKIILCAGVTESIKMGIPGESAKGVFIAYDYLKGAKILADKTSLVGKNVIVVGGGNVAMDCACTAKKLGSSSVSIVYRRSRAEMPAREVEIAEALEYGVQLLPLTNPKQFVERTGKLSGVECLKMQLGEPDSSGRPRPVEQKGSEFVISADLAILALGSKQNTKLLADLGLQTENGQIKTDQNKRTSKENIYACGDVSRGALTVVSAAVAGKKAASHILQEAGVVLDVVPSREPVVVIKKTYEI